MTLQDLLDRLDDAVAALERIAKVLESMEYRISMECEKQINRRVPGMPA